MHCFLTKIASSRSITVVLIGRITLGLRCAFYGPEQLDEQTVNGIPLVELEATQSAQIPLHWKENTQDS